MIDAERLQDAITALPEELLTPVDALRKQKRPVWKPIATVAASLLLVVGLYQLQPEKKSAENASAPQDAALGVLTDGKEGCTEEYSASLTAYLLTAQVTQSTEEYLVVTLASGETAKVYLEKVRGHTEFSPGTKIVLSFEKEPKDFKQLYPESICAE